MSIGQSSKIKDCYLIDLPRIANEAGYITPVESLGDVPFEIQRIYYLYDVPCGADRGGHAHKELFQLIVAASGSFNINLYDGSNSITYKLNRPDIGLLIVPGIWRDLDNFSSGAISLVLASLPYCENDYIRKKDEYHIFK